MNKSSTITPNSIREDSMKDKNSLYSFVLVLLIIGLCLSGSWDVQAKGAKPGAKPGETEYATTKDTKETKKKLAKEIPELPPFQMPYDPNIPSKRVLISSFDVAVPGLPSGLKAEKGLKAQLITTLSKSKNFLVIDREAISDLRNELILKKSRAVTKETAVSSGQLLGAQVIIKAVITEFSEAAEGESTGTKVSIGTMAEIASIFDDSNVLDAVAAADPEFKGGKETVTGTVGLDIRLIDVNTGAIIESIDARGELTRKNSQQSLGIAGFTTTSKEFEKTVIGQATRLAIQDAVLKVFERLKRLPWTGLVAAVRPDDTVIINAGINQNMSLGQVMYVESEGEKITDPATGLVLYTERTKTAEISIFSVKDNVSFGRVLSRVGFLPIQRGDIVTLK